jgi:hypothetical protein
MAYGIKYRTSYKRRGGGTTTIHILENDYSSTITDLDADVEPLVIDTGGDSENIYETIKGSGASIRLLVPPLTMTDLFTLDPQKYMVKVFSGSTGGTCIWQGFVNTGVYTESYSDSIDTPITITCNDGLNLFDNIPYLPVASGTTKYTGFTTIAGVMGNILSKINLTISEIYTMTNLEVVVGDTNLFLYLTVNNENYYKEDGEPMTCREVLESIWGSLGFVMTLRGERMYLIDPYYVYDATKRKAYNTTSYSQKTSVVVGGTLDISNAEINWYQTGTVLDIIQPHNQIDIKYDPYNFSEGTYDFNADGNAGSNTTYQSLTDGTIKYRIYTGVTMQDWTTGTYKFEAYQLSGATMGAIEYYIKQEAGKTGNFTYTFPMSNIKEDGNMWLELSMDVYVNTKHATNLQSTAAGTTVQELIIPMFLKVGNQWTTGNRGWYSTSQDIHMTIRTPDTSKYTKYVRDGWWFWRHTDVVAVDDSIINDTWTTCAITVNMGTHVVGSFPNGSITVLIPKEFTYLDCEPWAALSYIKNVLIKNVSVRVIRATDKVPINNNGVNTKMTIYSNAAVKKSKLEIELKNGSGTYGSSRGAFSSTQVTPANTNILGLKRADSSTTYDVAQLLGQSLVSQYGSPRTILTGSLDVSGYLLGIEQKHIKDTDYIGTKRLYVVGGKYNDAEEKYDAEMLEIMQSRESM